jgi:two-component system, NarL family, response regulator LiaR
MSSLQILGTFSRTMAPPDASQRTPDQSKRDDEHAERNADRRLRAIVADDDPFARRMIKEALQAAGFIVIAEAPDGRSAVELTLYYRPDIVVLDVVLPDLDGISATRQIIKEAPDQLVVVMSTAGEEEMGLAGLRAGAVGFLSKDLDIDVLPRALEGAVKGEAVISRRLAMRVVEDLRRIPEGAQGMRPVKSPLTDREWEVLDLLYEGCSTEELARRLVLSTETVRSHIKHILQKLNAGSRSEAVAKAQELRGAPIRSGDRFMRRV